MADSNKGLSVVVPSLGHSQKIAGLIRSLKQQDISNSQYEVIVVVNGLPELEFNNLIKSNSIYGSASENIMFIHQNEPNVNLARNTGMLASKFDYIYFLDDDCILENKSNLKFHLEKHLQDPQLFALGGGYKISYESGFWDELYNHIQMSWLLSGKTGAGNETRHLIGGNVSIKKQKAQQNSLVFDVSISYGGSEHQFFIDAVMRGQKLQLCNLDVVHQTSESFASIIRKMYKQGRGKAIIEKTRHLIDDKNTNQQGKVNFIQNTSPLEIGQLKIRFFKIILSYIFWFGYFKENDRPSELVVKVISDFFNYLNYLRFKIIDKFK